MRGNTFGKLLSITSFGESHGPGIGVVVDGVPGNLDFSLEDLQKELDRRAPGKLKGTTARNEADRAKILSGVFDGKTLGSPIAVFIENTNQRSQDYDKLKQDFRPGHADETTMLKYGIRDHRGGGRSSGRETIARVIGGYFASLVLPKEVNCRAFISKLGPYEFKGVPNNINDDFGKYSFPGSESDDEIGNYLEKLKKDGDSIGGRVRVVVEDCPKGIGEPSFDKLKADLAKAVMSIGAVVSFSYGLGEEMANMSGKEVSQSRDNFGGIEGGISNGRQIVLNLTIKPTTTIGEKAKEGRHDPCIIPRAIPVIESMVKLTLADHYLRQNAYQVSND
ncbi:MAG: chorismate synthase [Oligoflexia bacterium]|nr:chorismate synthase [Oligoflexia bacterium]